MVSKVQLITGAAALVSAGSLGFAGASLASADSTPSPGTSTTQQGVQGGGCEGRGPHQHTQVTGAEATKVTEAVKKKDSTVTVERVMKDADGSYDVMGTKSGERVMVEVSQDLATIEVRTGGPGGGHGPGGRGDQGDRSSGTQGSTTAPNTTPSTGTSPTDIPQATQSSSQAA